MQRNSVELDCFKLIPVEDFTVFSGFSCLKPNDTDRDLEEFIREDAERHLDDRIAVTYSLIDMHDPSIPIAFATLQNDSIVVEDENQLPGLEDRYPYTAFPAVKIGRLGVVLEMQKKQMGKLLIYLIKLLMTKDNRTGCRFITVDARRDKKNKENVVPFYGKCGFSLLTCRQKTSTYVPMYFDLSTFKQAK